jgi:homopolymeric O-antigen transport system ATP-binding protein
MRSNAPSSLEFIQRSDSAVFVRNVSKMFPLYNNPRDRLKQQVFRKKKYYKEFWALHNVSFDLKRGESRGILGHNGAGKSTLLRILAGTITPTSGKIFLKGRVGAIMTMGSGFMQDFTGRENVHVLGALMNVPKAKVDDQMDRIQDFAGIDLFFDKPVRTYSSGMLARLAFAVYTSMEPDILIVDEAINVGDAQFKRKCLEHVSELLGKGMSLLLVSHSPLIVKQFCQRATVLKKGEIMFDGDVEPALEAYNKSRP